MQGNAGGCGERIKFGLGLIYYLLKTKTTPKQNADRSVNTGRKQPGIALLCGEGSSSLGINEAALLSLFVFLVRHQHNPAVLSLGHLGVFLPGE